MKTTFKDHMRKESCLTLGTVTSSHPLVWEILQSRTIKPRFCEMWDLLLLQIWDLLTSPEQLQPPAFFGKIPWNRLPAGRQIFQGSCVSSQGLLSVLPALPCPG